MKKIKVVICLLLSGCAVGPDYQRPEIKVPQVWLNHSAEKGAGTHSEWWQQFQDPVIAKLIVLATSKNHDIGIAKARLLEARAGYIQARSALLPSLSAGASAERDRNLFPLFPSRDPYNVYTSTFDAVWEIDIFGGRRRQLEAADAGAEAAAENVKAVQLSIVAEVIRNYIDYCLYQRQISLTQENIATQQETVSLTQKQFEAGQAARFDYLRANSQMQTTQSQLPIFRAALSQTQYRIEVLLGEQPGALTDLLSQAKAIPLPKSQIFKDTPISVIQQRPDLQVVERQLASATALKGVEIADLYPKFSLSALVGGNSLTSAGLFKGANRTHQVRGGLRLPIFSFGGQLAAVDGADARLQEALLTYEKAVLAALAEVESASTLYSEESERLSYIAVAVQDAEAALAIAQKRYKEGLTSLLEVLDVERTVFNLQGQKAQVQANLGSAFVALGKALGTGWQSFVEVEKDKD